MRIALLALCLLGCVPRALMPALPAFERSELPLRVCVSAYAGEATEALELASMAVDVTNERVGFPLYVLADTHCAATVTVGAPVEPGQVRGGSTTFNPARTSGVRCAIETTTGDPELTELVLQHELGHCAGLDHDPRRTIMHPTQRPTPVGQFPPRISDEDRALLRARFLGP